MQSNQWKLAALGMVALTFFGCTQSDGLAAHGAAIQGAGDENHPASLRNVADAPPATMSTTLNALLNFPEAAHQ